MSIGITRLPVTAATLTAPPLIRRSTIPDNLPAGAVVEVHGVYDYAPTGYDTISGEGSFPAPIFIRGVGPQQRPTITRDRHIKGSHIILEHLAFADADGNLSGGHTGRLAILSPSRYVAVRKCEISGNLQSGGAAVTSWDSQMEEHVVPWDNYIHHNGDVFADYDHRLGGRIKPADAFVQKCALVPIVPSSSMS